MAQIAIQIQRLPHHQGLPLPEYQSARAAGCDLLAALPFGSDPLIILPGEQAKIPTGIAVEIPMGYEGQVRPRSGLAAKENIGITNSPGTIDSDFRGEIHVLLRNFGPDPFLVARGDRVAQLVITPTMQAQWIEVSHLTVTPRGEDGFGSTGRRGGEVRGLAVGPSSLFAPPPPAKSG